MKGRIALLGGLLLLSSLAVIGNAQPDASTDADVVTSDEVPQFKDVADERGLDFECKSWNKEIGLQPRFFLDAFFCGGPAIADYNGDGHLDVFFPNERFTNTTLNEEQNPQDRLYLNEGDGKFRDVTGLMDMDARGNAMAAAPVDHDGDGDLDLYVANYPTHNAGLDSPATTFYENTGEGFEKVDKPGLRTATRSGYDDSQFGSATAIADYDRDGDMDIYRGNYAKHRLPDGMPEALQETEPDSNNLYENNGDGTFTEATFETGASQERGRTFAVNFVDLDEDGWLDLYVANDENPNELYLNRPDPDGTSIHDRVFVDRSLASGADDERGSMCSEPADFDNDGHVDLYMTHYEDEVNGYHLGNGDGTFETRDTLGDLDESFHMLGWGCPGVDVDNDADKDLFVANAHMTPTGGEFFHPDDPADDNGYALPNQLYLNTLRETGTQSFEEVSKKAGDGFDQRRSTSGAEAADLDRDGHREIVAVNNNAEKPAYLDDDSRDAGSYLNVDLASSADNEHAIGARITVEAGGITQTEQRVTGSSMASGSVTPTHFGLDDASGPAQVTVEWPDGTESTHTVDVNQHVRIVQGDGVQHDTLAPTPTLTVDGEPAADGWHTADEVTVEIDATDSDGTLDSIVYRVDDGPLQAYDGPFTIDEDGAHEITVMTEDEAGNEAWFPYRVALDTDDPTAEITHPEEDEIRVQETGVDHPGDETVQAGPIGTQDRKLGYADGVVEGNAHETARQTGFDVPYPTSTREALAGTAGSDGHTDYRVDASDVTSGVDRVRFTVDGQTRHVDDDAPYTWDADLRGLDTGEHTVRAIAVDAASRSTVDEQTVHVVPTSAHGAQTSTDEAQAVADDPETAAEPAGEPAPETVDREALVEPLLEGIPTDPVEMAEPSEEEHFFETGQEPNPTRVGSYLPANERDAPIWRQFSFISDDQGGTVGQYVVMNPDTFLTSPEKSEIYQFPACQSLDPVLADPLVKPRPSGGEPVEWDRPTRKIVNVQLETGCEVQPESVDEIDELAVDKTHTNLHVNAPKLPESVEDMSPKELFNAPPYRPQIDAYQDGEAVEFITWEADWMHPWIGTNFPGENDVLIVSPSPTFRPDFTIFNVNVGGPNHPEFQKYSPIWNARCIVPYDNQKCMIGVNERAGFGQPRTSFEAHNLDVNDDGESDVRARSPNTFTHVNCPFVAVDQTSDDYIQPHEEIHFPNLWVNGPVFVN
jgi:hypothetical protein